MRIGVLAVQGAFQEHEKMLEAIGAEWMELRRKEDLEQEFDGLVLPGGESTVQGKLVKELEMKEGLEYRIKSGMPVLATCAGMILLAEQIRGEESVHLGLLPVTVKRNAYGRQLGSFTREGNLEGIGAVPMTFIRAPYVEQAGPGVQVLARVEEKIVAVRYGNILALSFHPELDESQKIHRYFTAMISKQKE